MSEKYAGTTINSSSVTTRLVDGKEVAAEKLIVNSQEITNISHSYTDDGTNSLVSAYSLSQLKRKFDKDVAEFRNTINDARIHPIVSEAITYPYFDNDSKWTSTNFIYQYGRAVFRNTNNISGTQATLELDNSVFLWTGTYFITLEIEHIPNTASLILYNNVGDILGTYVIPGKHMLTFEVTDSSNYSLTIAVNGVPVDDLFIINRVHIYYVQPRATDYFKYIGESIMSGGSGTLASTDWVNQKLDDATQSCNNYTNTSVGVLDSKLTVHMSNKNGHNAQPSDIGAASVGHTHTPTSIGAANKTHSHSPSECGASPDNHTHIPESIGAADRYHTHTPAECASSPDDHTHLLTDITDSGPVVEHVNTIGNAHDMVKANIDLGNLENYAVAEVDDFVNNSTDKYTTPDGVSSFLDLVFGDDPTKKYIPLAPKQILKTTVVLTNNSEYSLTLRSNALYEIYISCRATINANYLGMYIPEVSGTYSAANTMHLNSWEYSKTTDGDNIVTWSAEQSNMMYLTPKNVGNNIVKGKLIIDTTTYTMYGEYQSWVGSMDEDNKVVFITNIPAPLKSKCTFKEIPEDIGDTVTLVMRHNGSRNTIASTGDVTTDIVVTEYVNVGTEASMYDRSPLLSRTEFLGTLPPLGWEIENGKELARNDYQELADFLIKYEAYVDMDAYNASITNTGKCSKFGMDSTKIKLPTNPYTSTESIRIVKIKR